MRSAAPYRLRLWLVLLACGLRVPAARAQWLWRDKNGQVNASDRPPPKEVPDKDIIGRPAADLRRSALAASAAGSSAAPAASAARGPLEREIEARKRAAEQEQAAKAKADEERVAAQRAENCRRARSQVAALETGQRVARVNAQGEREVLDDAGRAAEMRQARDVIASDCK